MSKKQYLVVSVEHQILIEPHSWRLHIASDVEKESVGIFSIGNKNIAHFYSARRDLAPPENELKKVMSTSTGDARAQSESELRFQVTTGV